MMKKNYKLQNTNYKKITNNKLQKKVTGAGDRCRGGKALIKSFCGGSRGAVFSKRAHLAAGGD
jgi:hypothetical protein